MNKTVKLVFGSLAALIVIGVIVAWKIESARRNDPMYSLGMIEQIKGIADIEQKREFFTLKGYELTKWMASKSENQVSATGPQPPYSEPQFNSDGGCDVWVIDGDSKIRLHFVKGKYWQFDDMCLVEYEGITYDAWMSNMKDHPISTAIGAGLRGADDYVRKHMFELYSSLFFGLF